MRAELEFLLGTLVFVFIYLILPHGALRQSLNLDDGCELDNYSWVMTLSDIFFNFTLYSAGKRREPGNIMT